MAAVGESGSPSDLYSTSDSDDPQHDSNIRLPALGANNGVQSTDHDADHQELVERVISREGTQSSSLMSGVDGSGDADIRRDMFGKCVSGQKRKRSQGHDSNGFLFDPPPMNPEESSMILDSHGSSFHEGASEPLTSEILTKRSKLTEASSDFHRQLVEKSTHNLATKVSSLPVEVWQSIFCYVPPVFLGRLLRVNRTFHSLLTPGNGSANQIQRYPSGGTAILQTPESIWAASRKRFCPGLPRPLHGLSDLDMWRLLRGNNCQICGSKKVLLASGNASDPWHAGPGDTGVCVIWPFGIRSCGVCLRTHSAKEMDLLLNSTFPSFLLPGLPSAFVSQTGNYVTSVTLRNGTPPSDVKLTKHFYKPQVEEIQRRFHEARELGNASAEEWVKGLESEGRDRCNDAARWEQWEAKGGLKKVNSRPNQKPISSAPKHVSGPGLAQNLSAPAHVSSTSVLANPVLATLTKENPSPSRSSSLFLPPNPVPLPGHGSLPQRPQVSALQVRPERNLRDVTESKAARRAEIERRCKALDPPLEPNVLCHMDSFQAALQISTNLTDQAWEVLKPRLLAQREFAERREHERLQQGKFLQAITEERKHPETQSKETKDMLDKDWDVVQAPIRDLLATYADEIIRQSWADGNAVTKDTCAKFAADVLLYAHRRFYADLAEEKRLGHATNINGRPNSPSDHPSRKLSLENMKWLFDNKIKNFTDQFQKELFLCNGCEGNFKFYGFEGVIQHYAAKHTTTLSLGNIVVHWRADWPEQPPFHPNPSAAKAAFYNIPAPVTSSLPPQYPLPAPTAVAPYSDYRQTGVPEPFPAHYPNQFSHYPPPIASQYSHRPVQSPAYQLGSQFSAPPVETNGYGVYAETHPSLQPHHNASVESAYSYGNQSARYPEPFPANYPGSTYLVSQPQSLATVPSAPAFQFAESPHHQLALGGDLYQTQMNEMAMHARDVWFGTSGIKDLPQSVRIYVVIQHVVSRFERKYTNEPSLAMFIDGLDHNASMRPVRSLNGLACKTCATYGSSSSPGSHSHPPQVTTKLYTLPHLLNHFKSAHVEKVRSTVDLQSGLEASRLDWKKDMIELPEPALIADLVNAAGMDDTKLQLIASVFPEIFTFPLPNLSLLRSQALLQKYGNVSNATGVQQFNRDMHSDPAQVTLFEADTSSSKDQSMQSRPESLLQPMSRSSTRASEPPGDDEYDPNRPSYYGKMVPSRQFATSKSNKTGSTGSPGSHLNGQSSSAFERPRLDGQFTNKPEEIDLGDTKPSMESLYGDQPLRYNHQRTGLHGAPYHSEKENPSFATAKVDRAQATRKAVDASRYVGEDAEVNDGQLGGKGLSRSASRVAAYTAAERFLNEFNPVVDTDRKNIEALVEAPTRDRPLRQQVIDATPDPYPDPTDRSYDMKLRRQNERVAEQSMRSTPSLGERVDSRNEEKTRYPQVVNGNSRPYHIPKPPGSHLRYAYAEDGYHIDPPSTQPGDVRSVSHVDYHRPGTVERIVDVPRVSHEPYWGPRAVLHRSRSRSPGQVSPGIDHYRVRSPPSNHRHGTVYHVEPATISPTTHRQQGIRYTYPPEQMELDAQRTEVYPRDRIPPRVEYIPVRPADYEYRDQGRYIVAQPTEHRRPADHIQVPRAYVGEQLYERDGQYFYAEPQSRPIRTLPPGYVEYQDNYR